MIVTGPPWMSAWRNMSHGFMYFLTRVSFWLASLPANTGKPPLVMNHLNLSNHSLLAMNLTFALASSLSSLALLLNSSILLLNSFNLSSAAFAFFSSLLASLKYLVAVSLGFSPRFNSTSVSLTMTLIAFLNGS